MANLSELLSQLNLNSKQTTLFLSLVKLGRATATVLSDETKITRTHIYDLAQELIAMGLVSELEEHGIKKYEAVDHAGLLAYVSRQQKELAEVGKQLERAASEFNALQVGQEQKTKVRFFDGLEGVKNMYEEIRRDLKKQTEPSELLTIFSPEKIQALIPGFNFFDYPTVTVRDIVCDDAALNKYKTQMTHAINVRYKVWPKSASQFPTDNIAWLSKIAYVDLSTSHPSGIVIENKAIVETFTMWFNEIWGKL